MTRTRTNIWIDERYVEIIKKRYHLRNKTEVVNLALRYVAGMPMSREEALAMDGALAMAEAPPDSGLRTAE